jgi:cytochrome c-type biogenesis protein CcmE
VIILYNRTEIDAAAPTREGAVRRRVTLIFAGLLAVLAALAIILFAIRADLALNVIPDEVSTMLLPPR